MTDAAGFHPWNGLSNDLFGNTSGIEFLQKSFDGGYSSQFLFRPEDARAGHTTLSYESKLVW